MYSKTVIALFSLFLTVSFSVNAGYKSSYKSSYRSSYKSSSSSRSYSTPSSSSSSTSGKTSTSTSKSLSTSAKAAAVSAGTAGSSGSAKSSGKPTSSSVMAKKSVSGAKLVDKKGKVSTASKSSSKSSQRIPGTTGRKYASLSKTAPDNVRTIIRERERSGTDWTTLALMYWMLSSSNSHASSLSSSDKDWIQQQIKEQESNGESHEQAIRELTDAGVDMTTVNVKGPSVSFSYDMPKAFTAGHVWMFVVTASQDSKEQAPSCELKGATFKTEKDKLFVKWKAPSVAGQKTEMKCQAFGVEEVKPLVSA